MKISPSSLLTSAFATLVGYGATQLIRLITGIIIARLLTPDLLGIMVVVYVLRYSAEQLSDIGIGQSMISNSDAEKPDFYNTAWSLQLIRGGFLSIIFLAAAIPLSHIYDKQIFSSILPVVSLYFVVSGFASMSTFVLNRRMLITKLNIWGLFFESISSVARIGFAYFVPNIWGLVFGSFAQPLVLTIGSHFLIPEMRHKFFISKNYAWQIFGFGKWIFLSAILFFLSSNFDQLYLGKALPFALLGVFGIARALAGVVSESVVRLCRLVIFPLIASSSGYPREIVRRQVAPIRFGFLLFTAFAVSIFVALSDIFISSLYDTRYHAAGWMLPILSIGVWFTILSSVNEWTIIGIGKAEYGSAAYGLKFVWILIALPFATMRFGLLGAVIAIALSDLFRYFPILFGQVRSQLSFAGQDSTLTLAFFVLIILWECLRIGLGFGSSFGQVPLQTG